MSHSGQGMASPRVLQDWCRVMCANYPSVDIKNMSASFRDGLAFCAIIHKHRPDLIDFSSLSKDNVYYNNTLAFEVAETKLGIPALLDPQDMVSTEVPDCLSVITYISHYYYYFNKKADGPANLTKSKGSDGLKRLKSLTDLETIREDHFSKTRPRKVCSLCFKPVHLIQRHLIDGKVYHRSCFRCKVCHSTLLPDSYTQGSDTSSLICTYHTTDSKITHVNLSQQTGSTDNQPQSKFQGGFFSLAGLAISSVPHYITKTESQVRLVCRAPETDERERQERSREIKDREKPSVEHSQPGVEDKAVKEGEEDRPAPIVGDREVQQKLSSSGATEGSSRPVPAPRRMLDSSVVPVPTPRIKTSQTMINSPAAGHSSTPSKSPPTSSYISSPKVQTNHPWMAIVHPGPWTQLPPAPAPVPAPRSKSVSNLRVSWNRPRMPPPNPFEEEEEVVVEDTQGEAAQHESADQTKPSVAAVHSENGGNTDPVLKSAEDKVKPPEKPVPPKKPDFNEGAGDAALDSTKGMTAVTNKVGASSELPGDGSSAVTEEAPRLEPLSDATQSQVLPRSLSVPAITPDLSQTPSVPAGLPKGNKAVTSEQNKLACKENPFDRKPALNKSKTFQDLSSSRAPAPGHGFPLIKRKVQTDHCVSTEDLQVQMREMDQHLEALEQRGVELERNLRDCKNDKEVEHMLTEWFCLVHERHVLTRRDTELVYLTKQQKLEDRQADVEYELRCLLNKPEYDWSEEDRGREQKLMNELVAIIEQRNQIISCLDQDRQREREEDLLWEDMKNKCSQKEGLKEPKKSKGKFKTIKVFKMLNHKTESSKDSTDKKS